MEYTFQNGVTMNIDANDMSRIHDVVQKNVDIENINCLLQDTDECFRDYTTDDIEEIYADYYWNHTWEDSNREQMLDAISNFKKNKSKKYYKVHCSVRLTTDIHVMADNEDDALQIAQNICEKRPYNEWDFYDDDADIWEVDKNYTDKWEVAE